ncbi:MAG: ADOP family duplicated permease [Vicinamibacterales bacterium]
MTWLERLLPGDRADAAQGDLAELFQARLAERGVWYARARYCHDLAGLLLHGVAQRRRRPAPSPTQQGRTLRMTIGEAASGLRFAARALAARPGYSVIAILTLALGIGANVAIFSVVNSVLLRPLPFPDSARLVEVRHHAPGLNMPDVASSPGLVRSYQENAQTLATIGGYQSRQLNISGVGEPQRIRATSITPSLFAVLATRPALGRPFMDADASSRPTSTAILTHDFWRARFGGDPAIVGQTVQIDGAPVEIVGVMPAGFVFPDPETKMYVPLEIPAAGGFGQFGMNALARLAPGATLEQARAEIEHLQQRIPAWFPDLTPDVLAGFGWSASVVRYQDRVVSRIAGTLWVLLGTVALVLLIAGANVANLFLVRAESRQREVAIRVALGAGRAQVAGTYLAESVLLVTAGTAAGLLLAQAGIRLLVAYGPAQLPRRHEISMDLTALLFAGALGVVLALVLALVPMMASARRSSSSLIRDGGRGSTTGRNRHRLRQGLIVAQVAVALVLLVGAGLMLKSAQRMAHTDPGFQADGLFTAGISLGSARRGANAVTFYQDVMERLAAIPGVRASGAGSVLPVSPASLTGSNFTVRSRPDTTGGPPPFTMYSAVTEGYFEALGVPLLAGRPPSRDDAAAGRRVAWVNRTLADRFIGAAAVGDAITLGDGDEPLEIVGVVGDSRNMGLTDEVKPMVYLPMGVADADISVMYALVRTDADPTSIAALVRDAVHQVDPTVPITASRTMADIVDGEVAQASFTMVLLTLAAGVALALGVVGLYGVISYIVEERRAEIGVRLALGASPAFVQRMVLRQGVVVSLVGVGVGLVAAAASTRAMASLLFEVSTHDPATFVVVAVLLTVVGALASYLPARRASRVDPVETLREAL